MVALGVRATCPRSRVGGAPAMGGRIAGSRIATALAVVLAGAAAPARLIPRFGGVQQSEVGVAIAAPALQASAKPRPGNSLQVKRCRKALRTKLQRVPAFVVTNDGGSPFLSQLSSGDQSALMFIYPSEAQAMLKGVLKAPNGASSGAKITLSNLARAHQLATKPPIKSGLRDPITNRELDMVWQFGPHAAEQRAAQALLVKAMKSPSVPKLPAYMVEDLVYDKRGKEVRPIFLSRADAEAAIAKMAGTPESFKAQVEVLDLLALLRQFQFGSIADTAATEAEINSIEFVPPTESVAFQAEVKSKSMGTQARVVPPDFRWH
eukprot:scaffold18998_cov125-Isochrysis_galbana.AAC.5